MDIGNLLAEADAEVAYDQDDFEPYTNPTTQSTTAVGQAQLQQEALANRAQILQESASYVRKVEAKETKELFNETVQEVREIRDREIDRRREYDPSPSPKYDSDHELKDALNILVEASKEVTSYAGNNKEDSQAAVKRLDYSEDENEEESDNEVDPDSGTDDEDVQYDDQASRELLFAIHNEKSEQVQKVLRKEGVNIKYQDRHGWSALHWAASKGNSEIVELIIDHRRAVQHKNVKSLVNMQDKLAGWTPLHVSCRKKMVKYDLCRQQ